MLSKPLCGAGAPTFTPNTPRSGLPCPPSFVGTPSSTPPTARANQHGVSKEPVHPQCPSGQQLEGRLLLMDGLVDTPLARCCIQEFSKRATSELISHVIH
ncbi:hypothetical protein EPR50_G00236510 [Perca flavescens]|uniref:Uncharacterized protein n=1 Tax=Perca flavescens TaxID=8167 RepID=A0A484BZ41_PERFV|nr:hypothetical protein EPR50_G00236510 [Perca flavescens]